MAGRVGDRAHESGLLMSDWGLLSDPPEKFDHPSCGLLYVYGEGLCFACSCISR